MTALTRRRLLHMLGAATVVTLAATVLPAVVEAARPAEPEIPDHIYRAIQAHPFVPEHTTPDQLRDVVDTCLSVCEMHQEGWDLYGDDWPARDRHGGRRMHEIIVDLEEHFGEEEGRNILRDGLRMWLWSGKVAREAAAA